MESRKQKEKPETISVIETKNKLGIGINQTYEAVRRGEIDAIRIGRTWRVLTAPLDRKLGK